MNSQHQARWRGFLSGLVTVAILWVLPSRGQLVTREYPLKAVFLCRFTQFVDWPETAFPTADSPIIIGVLGQDPFGESLDWAVRNQRVHNRRLTVQRYQRSQDATNCHLLFISSSEKGNLEKSLADLKGRSILTVGDTEDFALRGGMIQFLTERNRTRFRINLKEASAANLRISSKLLDLATEVLKE